MKRTVSVNHNLSLLEINAIWRFDNMGLSADILALHPALPLKEIPGSLQISSQGDGQLINKTITAECGKLNAGIHESLQLLSNMPVIAIYDDAAGNRRICGSPDYPLILSYEEGEESFMITLSGKMTKTDFYLHA
ncbi:MAG: hypothetical protein HDS25_01005 [Bacteroides sp.]|nr:hypothetical protein [Bacteroides sp.]